jgi:hypothetical protein
MPNKNYLIISWLWQNYSLSAAFVVVKSKIILSLDLMNPFDRDINHHNGRQRLLVKAAMI